MPIISNIIKFPALVTAQSPLILTKSGASYAFSFDSSVLPSSQITVWQVRVALKAAGHFFTVDAAIPVVPGERIREAWETGGLSTAVNDDLYDAIAAAIGAPAAAAAYANASAITL